MKKDDDSSGDVGPERWESYRGYFSAKCTLAGL